MSLYSRCVPTSESNRLILPSLGSFTDDGRDSDSERDGPPVICEEVETDCGKCMEGGNTSVVVFSTIDYGDPNCPKRLRTNSAVSNAIRKNNCDVVEYYASQSPSSLAKSDHYGRTPFHYACWQGLVPIVFFLSTVLGCNVLATDDQGWSALHYACDCIAPQLEIIEFLVKTLKLDPRQETKKGSTPVMLAKFRSHSNIVRYLTDLMLNLKPTKPEDQRPSLMVRDEDESQDSMYSDHPNGDRNMSRLENRLFTFTMGPNWPRAHPTERQLAEQGFIYTGLEERVFCFCCKTVVDSWDDGVDPLLKHYDKSRHCQFLFDNFRAPLDRLLALRRIPRFNPAYASNSSRLHSFRSWQYSSVISYFKLASAGFFYTGVDLRTQCFSCGIVYDRWRKDDIPMEVHRRQNPNCDFIRSLSPAAVPMPMAPPRQPASLPVKQPDYESLENRIKSFKHLSKEFPVSREECAKAGLFFLRKPDVMQCFKCDAIVRDWMVGDVPAEKHRAVSPLCKFLREFFPNKLDSQSSHFTIDPSSLPEPEYTQEDLEKMSYGDLEGNVPDVSVLSLLQNQASRLTQPPRPKSSGYTSDLTQTYLHSPDFGSSSSLPQPHRVQSTLHQPHSVHSTSLHIPSQPTTLKQQPSRYKEASPQSQTSDEVKLCVVCMDNDLQVVLLPCRHMCVCESCSTLIDQCPMCRRHIENTVKVYLP